MPIAVHLFSYSGQLTIPKLKTIKTSKIYTAAEIVSHLTLSQDLGRQDLPMQADVLLDILNTSLNKQRIW